MDLSERKQKILQAIVDEYIGTAEPVGSRSISKHNELGLSSATIRNEMADLEEMGFIVKPHTSAGRVPSDIGYRFYVNALMQQYQMSVDAVEQLKNAFTERVNQLDVLIKKASVIASALTEYTTVVTTPSIKKSVLQKIDIVNIGGRGVMFVIITRAGVVKNAILQICIDEEDAEKLERLLNKELSGVFASSITKDIIDRLKIDAKYTIGLSDEVVNIAFEFLEEMIFNLDQDDVFVNNARSILKYPEFSNVEKAREMLEFLEDKESISRVISQDYLPNGVEIKIGRENNVKELENSSLVTVDYRIGNRTLGKIGVIGPKRMNYAKVIASLDCISTQIDAILEQLYYTEGEEN